jgi:hypothetical protein
MAHRTCPLTHRGDAPTIADDRCVCPRCAATLRGLLTDLPDLFGDLDIARTRQARIGAGGTSHAAVAPLPFALAPADARWVLASTLLTWLDHVTEIRGHQLPATWSAAGAYLTGAVDWLAAHPAGADAIDELTAAIRNARRAIDAPGSRQYAGPCTAELPVIPWAPGFADVPCGADLYAAEDADTVTCRRCAAVYPVAARRSWLLEQAADLLLPWREIARAVDGLGVPISENTLKSWVRRKRLVGHGKVPTQDGRLAETYRVGDVLDLVHAAAARHTPVAACHAERVPVASRRSCTLLFA